MLAAPDYTVLHADIGVALMDRGLYEDAEGIFADLAAEEEVSVKFSEMTEKLNSTSSDSRCVACDQLGHLPARLEALLYGN